jgi:hypothetical protein
MAVEARRGCGFRKVGGLYLVGSGIGNACDRLPIPLEICPCCGHGIKATRGWTWVDIAGLVGGDHLVPETRMVSVGGGWAGYPDEEKETGNQIPCKCPAFCPLCHNVANMGKGGLLWIGLQFYPTIEAFEIEARTLGVSRRITAVPRGFEVGKTWLLFAHARGVIKPSGPLTAAYVPAIFRVWKPERLERIYVESQRDSDAVKADIERGITPVYVPDNDKDHQGSVYDKDEESAPESNTPSMFETNGGNDAA